MGKEKILLVDDEPDILEIVAYNLKKEGFKILTASNGKDAISLARKKQPDLIVLDVMMPEMDGVETCYQLREIPTLEKTLIAFLTARNEDYSQIAGLDAGADDYITKPIKPKVLVSKIRAILRRRHVPAQNEGENNKTNILIDRDRYLVKRDYEEIILPRKEFELLSLLMQKPGKVFARETIMEKVWGDEVVVGERTIDVHIRKLRKRFGDHHIETISGVGYKFKE